MAANNSKITTPNTIATISAGPLRLLTVGTAGHVDIALCVAVVVAPENGMPVLTDADAALLLAPEVTVLVSV